jgi:FixJ family two-component response regulator
MYQSPVLSPSALPMNITGPKGARIPVVYVLDEGGSVREALDRVAADAGWRAEVFGGLLLARPAADVPNCLVLNFTRPGSLQLQQRLAAQRSDMPIICITDDLPMAVLAMKAGAVDVLARPVDAELLAQAIEHALRCSEASLQQSSVARQLEDRYASLSLRERQVMDLVVSGLLNKQVGGELGISEITVKAHRGRVMRKMNARSLATLVKMAGQLKLPHMADAH